MNMAERATALPDVSASEGPDPSDDQKSLFLKIA